MFWVPLAIFPQVGSLGQKADPFLIFEGISILLSTVAAPICFHTNSAKVFPFLHIHPTLVVCWFVYDGHSHWCEMEAYCGFDLHSVMASDAEHPFICFWTLWISSFEKCLFRSFAHFLIWLFVLLVWSHVSSSYILEIKSLSDLSLANMFSHMVGSLSILLMFSLAMQKLFNLM